MYFNEFREEVESLSSKYFVGGDEGYTIVYFNSHYKYQDVIAIDNGIQYTVEIPEPVEQFNKLPFSNKLYMLASELAITPVKERTPEGQMLAIVEHRRNREVSRNRGAARQERVAMHIANSPKYNVHYIEDCLRFSESVRTGSATAVRTRVYTGINDINGDPINVGDTVVEVFNFKNIPNMPDFEEKGEPFVVKKDCYLYSHWIARNVSEGSNFGVDGFYFGKNLLIKG